MSDTDKTILSSFSAYKSVMECKATIRAFSDSKTLLDNVKLLYDFLMTHRLFKVCRAIAWVFH